MNKSIPEYPNSAFELRNDNKVKTEIVFVFREVGQKKTDKANKSVLGRAWRQCGLAPK